MDDILLHEMIHQWQFEVLGDGEPAYSGHGPLFRDMANRIGTTLGLEAVRDCKRRGSDRDLPNCAYWPHVVRPRDYYLGAFVRPELNFRTAADLGQIRRIVAHYLRSGQDHQGGSDVLTETAVVNVLEAVADGIGDVTGEPRTFNAGFAARLLCGSDVELLEVQE